MKICLIHARQLAREVLSRALSSKLNAEVEAFTYCEDALEVSLDYDGFVVYNNFRKRMSGIQGVEKIRRQKPDTFIVGVTSNPNFREKFIMAGADIALLRAGNEVAELVSAFRQRTEVGSPVAERAGRHNHGSGRRAVTQLRNSPHEG